MVARSTGRHKTGPYGHRSDPGQTVGATLVVARSTGWHKTGPYPGSGVVLRFSGQDLVHDIAVDISESEITTLEAIGQLLVTNTHQVQDRSV